MTAGFFRRLQLGTIGIALMGGFVFPQVSKDMMACVPMLEPHANAHFFVYLVALLGRCGNLFGRGGLASKRVPRPAPTGQRVGEAAGCNARLHGDSQGLGAQGVRIHAHPALFRCKSIFRSHIHD